MDTALTQKRTNISTKLARLVLDFLYLSRQKKNTRPHVAPPASHHLQITQAAFLLRVSLFHSPNSKSNSLQIHDNTWPWISDAVTISFLVESAKLIFAGRAGFQLPVDVCVGDGCEQKRFAFLFK